MTTYNLKQILFISIISVLISSCGKKKTAEIEAAEVHAENTVELRDDQIKQAGIELGKIEEKSLNSTLKVSGKVTVSPDNMATVCIPLGGFVRNISVMPGSTVRKGQVLATIESQEFIDLQQNYLETKNKYEYAASEFKRHTELYKDDVYSQKNLQQVTTEYKNLKAGLNALKQKLSLIGIDPEKLNEDNISRSITLKSPLSGYVKTVNVNLGKNVSSTDVLFEIVNGDKLMLELTLYEKDAAQVKRGQQIRFYINNETDQHDAVILETSKSINDAKNYQVYATVSSSCKNIIPGMYVNALIESQGNKIMSVSSESVVSFDDKDYIFVFEKNKTENGKAMTEYKMIEVHKGIADGGFTGVTLPEGMNVQSIQVVVKGAYNLLSALKNAGEMSC